MIESIQFLQFQSLRSVKLSLGKLTVIVGPTNTGKTAVMRGIRAVTENRRGESFIMDNTDWTQIRFWVDGHEVIWQKYRKKSSCYFLDGRDSDQAEAQRYLKLYTVEFGKGVKCTPNFQNQLDSPFLLNTSDAVKSRVLGEITNANMLLLANNELKRLLRENTTYRDVRTSDVLVIQRALNAYRQLNEVKLAIEDGKVQSERVRNKLALLDRLADIQRRLVVASADLTTIEARFAKLDAVFLRIRQVPWEGLEDALSLMFKLQGRKEDIDTEVAKARLWKRHRDLLASLPDLALIEMHMQDFTILKGHLERVQEVQAVQNNSEQLEQSSKTTLEDATKDLDKFIKDVRICPLCENVMAAGGISEIV
jgi:hypothetical protein